MIELFVVWRLVRHIGQVLSDKGQTAIAYQVLAVVCWFTGEVSGAAIGSALFGISGIWIYLAALVGAIAGTTVAIQIAHRVPPSIPPVTAKPTRMWSIGIPVGVSLLASVCMCASIAAAAVYAIRTSPPLQATSVQIGAQLRLDRTIDPAVETNQHTRVIYLAYDLSTRDRQAVLVTIEWRRGRNVLASQTSPVTPGHHIVEFDAAEFPDGYLSPGEYSIVIRVDQAILSEQPLVVQ
jgi:hypothetical protein